MCVLALAWRTAPEWLLVAAGNRDEFHARPALPLARWADADVIAGRDAVGGGTWLGVGAERLAVVTNLRGFGGPDAAKLSRGALVTRMVTEGISAAEGLERYNRFNLIVAGREAAWFVTNGPTATVAPLRPGMHGLSNGLADVPWPKTRALKSAVAAWMAAGSGDAEGPFAALADETRPVPNAEERAAEPEPVTSPVFIRNEVYGTRCSTVVLVRADGAGVIRERRFGPRGEVTGENEVSFSWD